MAKIRYQVLLDKLSWQCLNQFSHDKTCTSKWNKIWLALRKNAHTSERCKPLISMLGPVVHKDQCQGRHSCTFRVLGLDWEPKPQKLEKWRKSVPAFSWPPCFFNLGSFLNYKTIMIPYEPYHDWPSHCLSTSSWQNNKYRRLWEQSSVFTKAEASQLLQRSTLLYWLAGEGWPYHSDS